jgi:hypothetical protein
LKPWRGHQTRNHDEFIVDLEETFSSLRKFRWKLNLTKCIFDVPSGKLLGFIISHRGIKVNPKKITTITNMEAPKTIKDIQKLIGCMATLNRFISRLGEWGLALFKLLKRQDKFQWNEEAEQALADLKHHLQSPPSSRLHCQAKIYYSTSPRLLTSLAQPLSLSAPRKAMHSASRGHCILLANFFLNLWFGILQFRNFSML